MRELILHNFWWKFASFIVATLIWLTIHSTLQNTSQVKPGLLNRLSQREFKGLTITVMTRASDRTDFIVIPPVIDVTLSGESTVLKNVDIRDIQVFVDLTEVQEAQNLSKQIYVHVPDGVSVQQVTPQNVRVSRATTPPTN